jgi:hypothetical protein
LSRLNARKNFGEIQNVVEAILYAVTAPIVPSGLSSRFCDEHGELDFSLPIELFVVSTKQAQPTAINYGDNSSQRNIISLLALLVAHSVVEQS